MKFKIGDRVRVIKRLTHAMPIGTIGTIMSVNRKAYGVSADNWHKGHNLDGEIFDNSGQYISEDQLELIESKQGFKVGDRVQFKTLEEMTKEYGNPDICKRGFTEYLHHLCGTFATITRLCNQDEKGIYDVYLEDFTAKGKTNWSYSTDMIKLVDPLKQPSQNKNNKWSNLSQEETTILDKFSSYKYIARDKNGKLFAYTERPVIDVGGLQWYSALNYKEIPHNLFRFIKWGNEPAEIKIMKEDI